MKIDIEKLGYRWKGIYGAGVTYNKGDVVRKDNKVQAWNGASWLPMGSGQLNAETKGELLTPGTTHTLAGVNGQTLVVNGQGELEFQYLEGRQSNAVWKLSSHWRGTNCDYFGGYQTTSVIMTDGSVRSWGRENQGNLGNGVFSDRHRSLPVYVAFPPGTPPIVDLYEGQYTTYAIDADGKLWSWGYNGYGATGARGNASNDIWNSIPRLVSGQGDLPADAVVTSVRPGRGYYNYANAMCQTSDGKIYYWGSNRYCASGIPSTGTSDIHSPRLVPASTVYDIVDYDCVADYHQGSWLITRDGHLYMAGEQNTIGRIQNNGNPNIEHELWSHSTHDPVKLVRMSESDRHVDGGSQYYRRYAIITQAGNIWHWGHNNYGIHVPGQDTWTPTLDTRNNISGDIVDCWVSAGSYECMQVLKSDGSIWGIGYGGHSVHNSNGADNNGTWAEIHGGNIPTMKLDKDKWFGGGSRYAKFGMGETTGGNLAAWGMWNRGTNGVGTTGTGYRGLTHFNRPIVDWRWSGYKEDGTEYGNLYILSDDGNLYSVGWGSYGLLGREDDNEDHYCLSPVLF